MTEQFEALDVYPTLTEEELKSTNGGHRPTEAGGGFAHYPFPPHKPGGPYTWQEW